jgi:D-alanyl-D-alanine carboxypeptidase/D-alanyl-D-alanine-endopeptidase (penicillin-binding protein 4)
MRPQMRAILSVLAAVLSLAAWQPGVAAEAGLDAAIRAVTEAPEYRYAHWGLLFVDVGTGETVYERAADRLFVPASTTKLFSVAAALDALGADYRFETPVYRRGDLDPSGELHGDLVLVASGDLTMGGRTDDRGRIQFADHDHIYATFDPASGTALTKPDPLSGLNELARQVAAAGIRRVRGEALIDDRLFERTRASGGSGPKLLTPILINDNLIDLTITPGDEPGEPAKVTWRPRSAALQVDASVRTVPKGEAADFDVTSPSPGRLIVRGRIPAGSHPAIGTYEVEDPSSWARSLFIEALARAGVQVDASALDRNHPDRLPARDAYGSLPRVAALTSPPFAENAKLILKVSHNLHANTLPLLVAAKNGKRTVAEGLRLEREFLKRAGVDLDAVSFGDGAGGSDANHVSPRAAVQLLRFMSSRPDFRAYEDAMPSLGVDGTLVDVLTPGSPARGKVHAKTGTLAAWDGINERLLIRSKALAGYMTTAHGRRLAFAVFVNGSSVPESVGALREGKALARVCEAVHRSE